MRTIPAILLCAVLAAPVGGCGEKDEPEPPAAATGATGPAGEDAGDAGGEDAGPTPEQQVRGAVRAVIGGGAPGDVCGDLVTQRYVRQAYGDGQGCRAAVVAQGVVEVDVSAVRTSGDEATAKAVPRGGPNRGENIEVELVRDGGWKVDSALSDAPAGP